MICGAVSDNIIWEMKIPVKKSDTDAPWARVSNGNKTVAQMVQMCNGRNTVKLGNGGRGWVIRIRMMGFLGMFGGGWNTSSDGSPAQRLGVLPEDSEEADYKRIMEELGVMY